MPAELEPHAATWVAWPHNPETWPGCLPEAEAEFEAILAALAASEPVRVLAQGEAHAEAVAARTCRHSSVSIHVAPSDDSWLRDTGPTFAIDAEAGLVAIDWTFNAWGGKYPPWDRDDAVAARVAALAGCPALRPGLVVEGGALEVDGSGTLIATRSSLLDPRRNPGLDRAELERRLGALLGVTRFVWLDGAIAGDDTDGHVDNLARFVAPGRVVCAREDDAGDPNHAPLEACRRALERARDARGRPLEVIDLPMPAPVAAGGDRLPASYANFYVSNRAVLVPTFGVPTDAAALDRLGDLFPDRDVVGVRCRALVRGLGAVHCLTQQQPAWPPTS